MKYYLFIVLLLFCSISYSQDTVIAYDYPIKPGTEAWKSLKNNDERLAACQVPDSLLAQLSTSQLVVLCMNNPLLGDILFSNNSFQNAYNFVTERLNCFQELNKRKDAGAQLLSFYLAFNLEHFTKNREAYSPNLFFDVCLDFAMGQPVFLATLDEKQENVLFKEALRRLKMRKELDNSLFRQKPNAVILSRILYKNIGLEKRPAVFKKDDFLALNNHYILTDKSYIDIIIEEAQNYINTK